jgi:uncharacterized membrane protein SpoIIM required for sporulation
VDRLYRAAVADLALAQRDFPHHDATTYLNGLVGKAHHLVYRGGSVGRRQIRRFFSHTIPQTVRRNWLFLLAAHLLFYLPALAAYLLVLPTPELAYTIFPDAARAYATVEDTGELWIDIEGAVDGPLITTNNIQVAFLAFAGGMLAGIYSIWVLVYNGMMLGAVFAFVQNYGLAGELGEFVIGHGPVELSVICMAGAAGLRLGHAMIAPGLMRRRDAVAAAGRDAMTIAFIGALWLVVAGTIEGFISPSESIPWWGKFLVGLSSGALMWAYFLLAGRKPVIPSAEARPT